MPYSSMTATTLVVDGSTITIRLPRSAYLWPTNSGAFVTMTCGCSSPKEWAASVVEGARATGAASASPEECCVRSSGAPTDDRRACSNACQFLQDVHNTIGEHPRTS